jgi:MoaA/NifB/PqqE/SkfB family radical SAM enzyme
MVKDLCFEVIEKCLNNCLFCSSNSNCNKKQIIEFDDYKRVIDYFMSTGGILELSLSGGEPFLHPDLIKMVEYAKSLGIRTVIFTSGVTRGVDFSEEEKKLLIAERDRRLKEVERLEPDNEFLKNQINIFYDRLLNPPAYSSIPKDTLIKLLDIGLDKIVFDYQAYEYETDHILMGRNEISRMALLKSLITAAQLGLDIDVHFVPMKPNYHEIGDILEMLEIAGAKNISLLNFLPQGRGRVNQNELQLTQEEKDEFFRILEEARNVYTGNIRIGIPLQGEDTHKCNAGLEKLDIKFDGTVLPCPAFKEITLEECERFNIKLPNIYTNLSDVRIPGKGTRVKPLCKEIYNARTKIN